MRSAAFVRPKSASNGGPNSPALSSRVGLLVPAAGSIAAILRTAGPHGRPSHRACLRGVERGRDELLVRLERLPCRVAEAAGMRAPFEVNHDEPHVCSL